jgi:hypothetical protein
MAPAAALWKTFTAATWAGDESSVGRSQKTWMSGLQGRVALLLLLLLLLVELPSADGFGGRKLSLSCVFCSVLC